MASGLVQGVHWQPLKRANFQSFTPGAFGPMLGWQRVDVWGKVNFQSPFLPSFFGLHCPGDHQILYGDPLGTARTGMLGLEFEKE